MKTLNFKKNKTIYEYFPKKKGKRRRKDKENV